jgi:secreted PhoX family phosphatase
MQTIRNFTGRGRFLAGTVAVLMMTCGAPSHAWCASKNLWISFGAGGGIESFRSGQLKKSGMRTPIDLSTFAYVDGLAFDTSNNLWAVNDSGEVVRYTAAQLKKLKSDPSPTPAVIITSASTFLGPTGCAFDHQGNLWVIDNVNKSIDELSKAQLAAGSADLTPDIVIKSSDLSSSYFLTFDKAGNVWMESSFTIVEFSASQLTSGGSKSPSVVLTNDGSGSIDLAGQIAFDDKGNLWVPTYDAETVVEFAQSQLGSSGDPTPMVTLSSPSFSGPWALTFESKGDLVVVNYTDGTIDKFTATQIKVSGSPVPKVSVTETEDGNAQITFGPSS